MVFDCVVWCVVFVLFDVCVYVVCFVVQFYVMLEYFVDVVGDWVVWIVFSFYFGVVFVMDGYLFVGDY